MSLKDEQEKLLDLGAVLIFLSGHMTGKGRGFWGNEVKVEFDGWREEEGQISLGKEGREERGNKGWRGWEGEPR